MKRCSACGSPVSLQFVRVFGDNQGVVDECPNCSPRSIDSHVKNVSPPRL
ncbi:DUF7563 family protein [Natrarchaeobius versutus]